MRKVVAPLVVLALTALGVACGDIYVEPFTEPPPPSEADAAASVVDATFPDPPSSCPQHMPPANTHCELPGSTCEYGTSADMECNITLACMGEMFNGYWFARRGGSCPKGGCPTGQVQERDGKPCVVPEWDSGLPPEAEELVCNVDDGVCACTTGADAMHPHERRWVCKKPISGCPPKRPLVGQPCQRSRWCDYLSCDSKGGVLMECQNGRWTAGTAPCN